MFGIIAKINHKALMIFINMALLMLLCVFFLKHNGSSQSAIFELSISILLGMSMAAMFCFSDSKLIRFFLDKNNNNK